MGRFSNSWKVFKQSLDVLKHDKELLLLPILSGIASIIVIASFVFPMYFTGILETLIAQMDAGEQNAQYLMAGIAFVLYLLLTFVTIYFNAGIVYAAHMRLDGKDPKLSDALKGPSRHLAQIFLWAMFVATVSLLMRIIQQVLRERAGPMVAMLFGWLAGAAWWMATYFAIPVVVIEGRHVGPALKRSTGLFKQRWGESLIGEFGLGIAIFMLNLAGIAVALVGAVVGMQTGLWPVALVFIVAGVLWLLFVNLMLGPALNAIYKAALYHFATKGEVAPYFSPDTIQNSWIPKGQGAQTGSGWTRV
jgi:hypothetical protein